ncbi:MFS transporter [Nocardia vermiculata]|uniref:MHS family MFS transporter n=1 Tax=Nocardia vermiculata TaxID=257274 RepID=A0A846XXD3_9NOCA|nr:MFS transporter [Nocardia vermiculata]NKY48859.1 MHS family MFS transporter [Nocardia vermiculata]
MTTITTQSAGPARRAALAGLVGTTIEWFDFFIYGLAAALVFGNLFFPSLDPHSGRLASFATLGVAFIARPIGAAIFGHLGDRLGRKATLVTTLGIMGTATGLIGVLPTYHTIGIAAPLLLIVLRMLQGVAVGGEWGGAVLMSVEHAPSGKRRLYGSAPQMGSPLGLILATAVMAAVATLPDDQLHAWGWRVPFLAGFVLVGIGLFIRLGVSEPAQFAHLKHSGETSRMPLREVLSSGLRGLVVGTGLQASVNVVFYLIAVYFLTYATAALDIRRNTALLMVMAAAVVDLLVLPLIAAASDRIGARSILLFGTVFTGAAAYPFFWLLDGEQLVESTIVLTVMLVGAHATVYAVVSSVVAEQFETRVRYSGTAMSNALGALLFSAPTPLIAEAVVGDGSRWWPLALITLGSAVISMASAATISHLATPAGDLRSAAELPAA